METTERTYYAVPTNYGKGDEYEDIGQAVEAAKLRVQRFLYKGQTMSSKERHGSYRQEDGGLAFYSRAFVDRRVANETGDKPVERIEVFLTDAEKDALS